MNHGAAESEDDLKGLLLGAGAAIEEPLAFLVPLRSGLFRWCLEEDLRLVKPMNLMALGDYREPQGGWFPSVLYGRSAAVRRLPLQCVAFRGASCSKRDFSCVPLKSNRWPDPFLATTHGYGNESLWRSDLGSIALHGKRDSRGAAKPPRVRRYAGSAPTHPTRQPPQPLSIQRSGRPGQAGRHRGRPRVRRRRADAPHRRATDTGCEW